jgi:hypothetical protein
MRPPPVGVVVARPARVAAALALLFSVSTRSAAAVPRQEQTLPAAPASSRTKVRDRPKVTLDKLDLTKVPLARSDETFLRKALEEEAKRADWGAGASAHIEYRFRLDELSVTEESRVVRIRCSASGFLPKGRRARSHIAFGGAPNERQALVHHVLQIVASGVVTRLSEIERRRRSRPE